MSDQDTTKINRYLLGQLPTEEADRIEARLLSETGLFELAESVEDEIIDRYVRGELSPEERRRFERRLLSSERIAERVAFARALAAQSGDREAVSAPHAAPIPLRREATVVPLFRPAAARLAWAATLALAVLGGWLAFQVVRLDDRREELEAARIAALERAEEATTQTREAQSALASVRRHEAQAVELERELDETRARIAELESEGLPAGSGQTERRVRRPGDYGDSAATASLFLGLATRSGGGEETLRLAGKEWAELELELGGQALLESLTATVSCAGRLVLSQAAIKVRRLGGESVGVLILPAEAFEAGPCRVELRASGSELLLGSYEFSVDR